jgi:SAM-dependent methyltransferase
LNDPFLQPSAAPANIDRFLARQGILDSLRRHAPHFRGVCLDVGCGDMPYRPLLLSPPFQITSYIGLDRPGDRFQNTQPDLFWDNERIPLATATVDCALCTEVLEHCPNPLQLLQEVQRVLKPGGTLILTVPFLWPLHEVPHDWCRYTPFALRHLLDSAGFHVKDLRSLGGYDHSLAQMLGLWVRRRPMNRWLRFILTLLIYPAWTLLRQGRDADPSCFDEGKMITGLVGLAKSQGRFSAA